MLLNLFVPLSFVIAITQFNKEEIAVLKTGCFGKMLIRQVSQTLLSKIVCEGVTTPKDPGVLLKLDAFCTLNEFVSGFKFSFLLGLN